MRNRWFHLPTLHTALHHEKKVSWLELFYDLVFVAAIIQLGDSLSTDVTNQHAVLFPLVKFAVLFAPIWLAWTGFTFFANRFDVDDFLHRLLVFGSMFSVAAMAIASREAIGGDPLVYTVGFASAQFLIAAMYFRAWKQVPEARPYSRYWGIIFAVGGVLWTISLLLPQPFNYVLWAVGLLGVMSGPISRFSRELTEQFPIDMEHLSERYGLLTIIVLGESFVKVLSHLTDNHGPETEYLLKGCFGLMITCCIWWLYFDDVAGAKVREQRGAWIVWLYGHLPLTMAITAAGVAVKKTLVFDFSLPADDAYRWLVAATLALTFFSVGIVDSVTERRQAELSDRARVNVRLFSALAILLLGQIGASMSAGLFLALVAILCLAQVVFDMMMSPLEDREVETLDIAEVAKRREKGEAVSTLRRDIRETVRRGAPADLRRDLYFFFMQGTWTRLMFVLTFMYLVLNVVFAALFLLEPGSIKVGQTFSEAFFFSVQTMSTIGYGVLSPATDYGNMLVTAEAAVGVFGAALATGLMFAKASRPQSSVLFSEPMIISDRDGKPTLMFRAGNARGNEVVEATISVNALVDEISPEGHHIRRIMDMKVVRDRSPIFSLSWTVMHVIDEDSPLFGVDLHSPNCPVLSIIVTMIGHDSTYGQQTFARHMYRPEDTRINHRFVDVISQLEDGRLMIDFTHFHKTEAEETT